MVEVEMKSRSSLELLDKIKSLEDEIKVLKNQKDEESDDPLLSEDESRYVIFPIKNDEIWKMYKKAEANFLNL